jgi:hypothetical protein
LPVDAALVLGKLPAIMPATTTHVNATHHLESNCQFMLTPRSVALTIGNPTLQAHEITVGNVMKPEPWIKFALHTVFFDLKSTVWDTSV